MSYELLVEAKIIFIFYENINLRPNKRLYDVVHADLSTLNHREKYYILQNCINI